MTKVAIRTLDSVTNNDTTATQLINENFTALQTAIENTLSRDGTTPNFMDANLDLNSYKIINAGTPTDNTDVITKEYFDQNIGDAAGYAEAAEQSANRATTSAQVAQGYSNAAAGAADVAQNARDFIESDPGFVAVSTDLLLGENSSIKKTSDDLANIDTVAGSITNVDAVGTSITNVNAVANNLTDIDTVATNVSDINSLADDMTKLVAVADDLTNIDSVADNLTNIDAVVDNETNINAVAGDLTNIDTVANNETSINKVANKITEVDTVAWISGDVTTVAGNSTNINTVAEDITNVNAVAADLTNINAVAADLTNIDAASGYAAEAKQWAIGDPSEPTGNSSKYWAEYAQQETAGVEARVTVIEGKIPSTATSSNQLTDKSYVDTADNNLQTQIDAIVASSDVFDIVATYAALQAYDITTVPVNDIIKVLVDETHSGAATYYRCVESGDVKSWSYIGAEGAYYTKGEADSKFSTILATGSSLDYTGTTLSLENAQGTVLSSVTIKSSPDLDSKSITKNASNELQTVGVIDSNNTTNAIKTWTGTKAQYDAIVTKDANTLYNITDDTDVSLTILEALYPVGSVYITTANTCPLSALINGSTWELVSSGRVLQGADSGHSAGTTIEAGLPNHTHESKLFLDQSGHGQTISGDSGYYKYSTNFGNVLDYTSSDITEKNIWRIGISSNPRETSIYGNSSTVQPPAYVVNIFERIA